LHGVLAKAGAFPRKDVEAEQDLTVYLGIGEVLIRYMLAHPRVLFRGLLVAALAGFWSAAAAAGPAVVGVRIGEHPDRTRFVLDLTEKAQFRVFTLGRPYRVVIDFPEIDWRLPFEANAKGRGVVERYRFGLFRPGTFRVVLDVRSPVKVREAYVMDPRGGGYYRFVLDLARVDARQFEAALRANPPPAFAPRGPRVEPPPLGQQRRRADGKRVVVLDPGHGGIDPGTIGRGGTHEKRLTLSFAVELKRRMEKTGRYHVVLTRDRDVFLELRERIAAARDAGGEIFLSLHADSIADKKVRGVSVYTLSETASDAEAEALATKENKADVIAGVDLSHNSTEVNSILIDLAQRETMNNSGKYAQMLIDELRDDVALLRRTHRFAGFAVLKAPDVPSVLVELGYLSNGKEEKLLRRSRYRAKIIDAIVRAADTYFAFLDRLTRS